MEYQLVHRGVYVFVFVEGIHTCKTGNFSNEPLFLMFGLL